LHNSVFNKGASNDSPINGPLGVGTSSADGVNNYFEIIFNEGGGFSDSSHPIGLDDTWGTSDDGLRPRFESAIVNAGDSTLNNQTVDITGQDRIIGDTIDVGAYEFTECNDSTEYIGGSWTNGLPTPSKNVIFKDDYNTLSPGNGSILACKCTVDPGKTLTIGDGTALHVYFDGINISGSIIVEEGGSVVNGIWQ
jgi:hypothetical protein